MKRKLIFLATVALLVTSQVLAGTSFANSDKVGEKELHAQARNQDENGIFIPLTGQETKGKTVALGNRHVELPDDAYVKRYAVTVSCSGTDDCVEEPIVVLVRGNAEAWVGKKSGRILRSHGDIKAFDFVSPGSFNVGPHYPTEYSGERQDFQSTAPGIENFVNWDIVQGRPITYWVIGDSRWPAFGSYVSAAISGWNSALGRTYFAAAASQSTANLIIMVSVPGVGAATWGPDYYWNSPDRNANYVAKSTIEVNMAATTPAGGWSATIAHELGHALGLGEQYSGTTCTPTPSVMWSGDCLGRPSGPTSTDVSRVNAAYNTGSLLSFTGSASGGTYTVTWTDGSWGENYVSLAFERYFASGWSAVANVAHLTNTGPRSTASWNTLPISRSFSLSTYGLTAGTYRVCGNTVHYWNGFYTYGPRVCGPGYSLQ